MLVLEIFKSNLNTAGQLRIIKRDRKSWSNVSCNLATKPGCPFYCQRSSGGVLLDGKTRRDMELWSCGALELWQLGTVNVGRQEDERLRQSVNTNVRLEQDDPPNSHHNMRSHHGRAGKPPQYNNFGF